MSFVSYAQNYEDVMLWRAFKDVEKGFFIDIGANAPVGDSVTYAFYERGWRGINVEPVSQWFEMLNEIRPDDINLNVAVSDAQEYLTLYDIPDTGLATADQTIAERHRGEGRELIERRVAAVSLDSICQKYAEPVIHFLKIDVEGAEASVIRSLDLTRFRPQVILVEATLPNSTQVSFTEWESLITEHDYSFVYFDGLNRFYVAAECEHLQQVFATPPNVLDDFMQYREVMHRQRMDSLQAQLDAERALAPDQAFKPLDVSALEALAWPQAQGDSTDSQLQLGAGVRLVFQQQQRMEQAVWRLAKAQAQQARIDMEHAQAERQRAEVDAERLRQQDRQQQRRIWELEREIEHLVLEQQHTQQDYVRQIEQTQQQMKQAQQQTEQVQQQIEQVKQQVEQAIHERDRIAAELYAVHHGTVWRMTKPVRLLGDYGKPVLRKIRDGGSAWVRLTPESRPRRTARKLKHMLLVYASTRPALEQRLERWLGWKLPPAMPVQQVIEGQTPLDLKLSPQAAAMYRKLRQGGL